MTIFQKIKTLNILKEAHRELGNDEEVKNINETIASISIIDVLTDKKEVEVLIYTDEGGGLASISNKEPNVIVDCNHD